MSRPGESDARGEPDDLDLTEAEFDARFAASEPVVVVGVAPAKLRKRAEDYYTLQMSDAGALASGGQWGRGGRWGPRSMSDQEAPLVSHA
jgi:hypothetical protein